MRRAGRGRAVLGTFIASALFAAAACVDLFHSTDFATLCAFDAAACSPEAGSNGDVSDAPEAPIDLCAQSPARARELAERTCGWVGACLGTLEDSTLGACMVRALAAYDCVFNPSLRPRGRNAVLWQCLSKVGSCDDV